MIDHLKEFSDEKGCSKCGSELVTSVKYTWWGGMLGPKIFHHNKCESCGYTYNSKTRKSNTPSINIYSVIIFVIAFVVFYFLKTT